LVRVQSNSLLIEKKTWGCMGDISFVVGSKPALGILMDFDISPRYDFLLRKNLVSRSFQNHFKLITEQQSF